MSETAVVAVAKPRLPEGRIAGIVLIVTALVVILAMSHHPSGGSLSPGEGGGHVLKVGGLTGPVHGTMIAAMFALVFGYAVFAARLGFAHLLVIAAVVCYAIGAVAHIGAALINGFVVDDLASHYVGAVQADLSVLKNMLRLTWAMNQALAGLGVLASSAGIVFFSLQLLQIGPLTRLVGLAGLAAGILPALAYATNILELDVAGAFTIYAAQAFWTLLVGALLVAKKI